MKKSILSVLLALALVCLFSTAAFAVDYPYITVDNSDDFTIVVNVAGGDVTLPAITVVGLDSNYDKHAFDPTEVGDITWSIPGGSNVARLVDGGSEVTTLNGTDSAVIRVKNEGAVTVTVTYDTDTADPVSVPIFVVGEDSITNSVSGIDVEVNGDTAGFVDQDNLTVPLFDLKDVFPGFSDDDVADVLKKNPGALHALLYALELENDPDTGNPWDWDWVSNNVEIISQGSYVAAIVDDWYGWAYTIDGDDPEHAASAHKLSNNDEVVWTFTSN